MSQHPYFQQLPPAPAVGGKPAGTNYDFPNPRGRPFPADLRTFFNAVELQLIGQDKFFGVGGPSYDYPNPRGAAYPVALQTFVSPVFIGVLAAAPTAQTDWPNPRGRPFPADLRSFLNAVELQLIGQDKFFGVGGPTYDWPNPRGAAYPVALRTFVSPVFIGALGAPPAIAQYDWPNPRGPIHSIALRTFINPVALNLRGQDAFFGVGGPSYDYPNPRGPQQGSVALKSWLQSQNLGSDKFFGLAGAPNFDWPNPRGPLYPIALRTFVDPLKLDLRGKDATFGLGGYPNFDWPNPRGPRRSIELLTFAPPVDQDILGATPYAQYDWPNPRGPLYAIALRTFVDPLKLELLGHDATYGLGGYPNFDWPDPRIFRGRVPPIDAKTWVDPLKLDLLGKDQTFGLGGYPQFDWPVPKGARRAIDLLTWIFSLNLDSDYGSETLGPLSLLITSAMAGQAPILGWYIVPADDIYDLGYVGTLTLSESWKVTGSPAAQNILALSDFLSQTDIFGAASAAGMISWIEINIGVPAADGSIVWGGWQKYAAGSYPGQYLNRRLVFQAPTAQVQGSAIGFADTCSVPSRIDNYLNQTVLSSSGLTIAFTPAGSSKPCPFNKGPCTASYPTGEPLPAVQVTWQNQAGDELLITSLTLAGITLQILNGGVGVTRAGVNLTVQGF
jgi:hypothetical protein